MMKKAALIIFSHLIICSALLARQDTGKCSGRFGIEVGVGYNTATWKYTNLGPPGMAHYDDTQHKIKFWVQPSARIFYSITLHNFSDSLRKKLKMPVFIGYYTFGGAEKGNGFSTDDVPPSIVSPEKVITFFRSIETGINPCFEKNKIQIGLLLSAQYIFSARSRAYYDPWNNGALIQDGVKMEERDISNDYKNFAMNTGIKFKYKIIKGFSIAGEAWFGITNLYAHANYGDEGKLKVTENNYRILLGYEF